MNTQIQSLGDLVGLQENKNYLQSLIENPERIPHFFFYGNPGTGKTSTINSFLNDLKIDKKQIHFFNMSYKNGVEFVRNRIMSLCRLKTNPSLKIPFRFIILDEFDSLTKDSQPYISYCMRQYPNIKFCMISNTINNIISSIMENAKLLHFDDYQEGDYIQLIRNITKKRNVEKICNIASYDMRKILKIKDIYLPILDKPLDTELLTTATSSLDIYRYISQKLNEGYDYQYIYSFYRNSISNWLVKQYLSEIDFWFMKNINYKNVTPTLSIAIDKMRSLLLKFP